MRLPYFLLLLLLSINTRAQNILSNGSFEQYTTCPAGLSQMGLCTGWRQYTNATSDFFHDCNPTMIPGVYMGWQYPAHGDAYAGFYSFSGLTPASMWKEYIATTIPPLVVGGVYEVAMSFSLSNSSIMACSDLGVLFYDSGPTTITTTNSVGTPQISYASYGPITDTQNWVRVVKTFVADSAYDNIVIGGFKNWSQIGASDTLRVKPAGFNCYYYVDSVVIRLVDNMSFSYNDTLLCVGDSVIAPFTANAGVFTSSNVFSLQLSDASGSFASPTTIATLASNTSGTLKGVVPNTVTSGAGYKLRIVASNPVKTVVAPKNISIGLSQPAKPVATGNSPIICSGDTLFLNATTTTTGVTWDWTGPNSFTSTLSNPFVSNFGLYNAGDYIVTVRTLGCESIDTVNISYQAPLVLLNAANSGPVCNGAGLTLSTTNSSQGSTYSWTGPNGFTSPLQNPSFSSSTLNLNGDYVVTATLNGCTTRDTTTVLVKPVPVATAANSAPVCEDGSLNLTGTSSINGSTFAWAGPLGYSSNQQSPAMSSVTPGNSGNYTVIATKDGCSSQPAITTVIVYPTPATPVANANSIMCDGSPLNLSTATVLNASYSWTGPSGFSSTLQNPSINPATFIHAGYYSVRTSVNGCISAKDSVLVTVNIIPKIGAWASPDDTICEGTMTTYVAIHSNGGVNPMFQWYKNYVPITGANGLVYNTANLKTGDVFFCTMYSVGVCTDPVTVSTDTISMVVLPIVTQPSATISSVPAVPQPDKLVTFTAHVMNGGPNPKYQWQLNGTNQLGATSATWSAYTLKPFDKVNVLITSDDPCALTKKASSDTITLGFATTINAVANAAGFNVYPNPNDGNFNLTANNVSGRSVKLELLNAVGQVVYQEVISATNGQVDHSIRLSHIASGIYLLKLYDNGTINTMKLNIR